MIIPKSVKLEEDHCKALKAKGYNISAWIRAKMIEEMNKE